VATEQEHKAVGGQDVAVEVDGTGDIPKVQTT